MAHGAPDHVRMGDVNLLDYVDKRYYLNMYNIAGWEHWEFVTVAGVGCLGLIYFWGTWEQLTLKVTIDSVIVFNDTPSNIFNRHANSGQSISTYCGCNMYNAIHDRYGLWVDYYYQMSFKSTLQIEIYNPGAAAKNIWYTNCLWKERV